MANNGKNYIAAYENNGKAAVGEFNGHVKTLFDIITYDANVKSIGVKSLLGILPKGARVLGGFIAGPSLGTTGIGDFGYEANGVDTADTDGFAASVDMGGQAAIGLVTSGAALGKKFSVPTTVSFTLTEATTAALDKQVIACLFYIVD